MALSRASGYYLDRLLQANMITMPPLNLVPKTFERLQPADLPSNPAAIKVHVFSNVLDFPELDLGALRNLIVDNYRGDNIIVATSPRRMDRLDAFANLFADACRVRVVSSASGTVPCWRYRTVTRRVEENDYVYRTEKVFLARI